MSSSVLRWFCDHDPFTPCNALIVSMYAREGGREGERGRNEKKRGGRDRDKNRAREWVGGGRELNSKTLFYKDCSLGLVKNLTTSPC